MKHVFEYKYTIIAIPDYIFEIILDNDFLFKSTLKLKKRYVVSSKTF